MDPAWEVPFPQGRRQGNPLKLPGLEAVARVSRLVCCCLILTLALSCSPGPDDSARPADQVRAIVPPFLSSAPFYIAAAEGFFADENLDVEFVRLARNIDGLPALAQGEVDVGTGQLTVSVLNAMSGGARIRAVAGSGYVAPEGCAFMGIVIRRDMLAETELADPALLRGRRVRMNLVLPEAYWFAKALLPAGLTLEDFEAVNVPPAAMVDGFVHGSYDVLVPSEPRLLQLAQLSDDAVLWRSIGEVDPDYQVSMVFFGPTLLDERPDVGERFLAALVRGMRQYQLGKTDRNLDILEQATKISRQELISACWALMDGDGRIRAKGFAGYQAWATERGLLDRILTEDELTDRRFLRAANSAGNVARN